MTKNDKITKPQPDKPYRQRRLCVFSCRGPNHFGKRKSQSLKKRRAETGLCRNCRPKDENPNQTTLLDALAGGRIEIDLLTTDGGGLAARPRKKSRIGKKIAEILTSPPPMFRPTKDKPVPIAQNKKPDRAPSRAETAGSMAYKPHRKKSKTPKP